MSNKIAPGWEYPNGLFYVRACKMMGIDPTNNPNYNDLVRYDKLGIINNTMPQFVEHLCKRLNEL